MDLTPVEVDTLLSEFYNETFQIRTANDRIINRLNSQFRLERKSDAEVLEHAKTHVETLPGYQQEGILRSVKSYETNLERIQAIDLKARPYEDEFIEKRWSRFFMTSGVNAHIHSSMNCSTCNRNGQLTRFSWLPELSGKTEGQAVAEHGARLCTVCFPSAPVEWTNHYEVQEQQKKASQCAGSGTFHYDAKAKTTRKGYYGGNGAVCLDCGEFTATTSTGKLRSHKK